MTGEPARPACIKCGRKRDVGEAGNRRWYCHKCNVLFDDEPEEGGDYYRDPSRRMENQESRRR